MRTRRRPEQPPSLPPRVPSPGHTQSSDREYSSESTGGGAELSVGDRVMAKLDAIVDYVAQMDARLSSLEDHSQSIPEQLAADSAAGGANGSPQPVATASLQQNVEAVRPEEIAELRQNLAYMRSILANHQEAVGSDGQREGSSGDAGVGVELSPRTPVRQSGGASTPPPVSPPDSTPPVTPQHNSSLMSDQPLNSPGLSPLDVSSGSRAAAELADPSTAAGYQLRALAKQKAQKSQSNSRSPRRQPAPQMPQGGENRDATPSGLLLHYGEPKGWKSPARSRVNDDAMVRRFHNEASGSDEPKPTVEAMAVIDFDARPSTQPSANESVTNGGSRWEEQSGSDTAGGGGAVDTRGAAVAAALVKAKAMRSQKQDSSPTVGRQVVLSDAGQSWEPIPEATSLTAALLMGSAGRVKRLDKPDVYRSDPGKLFSSGAVLAAGSNSEDEDSPPAALAATKSGPGAAPATALDLMPVHPPSAAHEPNESFNAPSTTTQQLSVDQTEVIAMSGDDQFVGATPNTSSVQVERSIDDVASIRRGTTGAQPLPAALSAPAADAEADVWPQRVGAAGIAPSGRVPPRRGSAGRRHQSPQVPQRVASGSESYLADGQTTSESGREGPRARRTTPVKTTTPQRQLRRTSRGHQTPPSSTNTSGAAWKEDSVIVSGGDTGRDTFFSFDPVVQEVALGSGAQRAREEERHASKSAGQQRGGGAGAPLQDQRSPATKLQRQKSEDFDVPVVAKLQKSRRLSSIFSPERQVPAARAARPQVPGAAAAANGTTRRSSMSVARRLELAAQRPTPAEARARAVDLARMTPHERKLRTKAMFLQREAAATGELDALSTDQVPHKKVAPQAPPTPASPASTTAATNSTTEQSMNIDGLSPIPMSSVGGATSSTPPPARRDSGAATSTGSRRQSSDAGKVAASAETLTTTPRRSSQTTVAAPAVQPVAVSQPVAVKEPAPEPERVEAESASLTRVEARPLEDGVSLYHAFDDAGAADPQQGNNRSTPLEAGGTPSKAAIPADADGEETAESAILRRNSSSGACGRRQSSVHFADDVKGGQDDAAADVTATPPRRQSNSLPVTPPRATFAAAAESQPQQQPQPQPQSQQQQLFTPPKETAAVEVNLSEASPPSSAKMPKKKAALPALGMGIGSAGKGLMATSAASPPPNRPAPKQPAKALISPLMDSSPTPAAPPSAQHTPPVVNPATKAPIPAPTPSPKPASVGPMTPSPSKTKDRFSHLRVGTSSTTSVTFDTDGSDLTLSD